MPSRTGWASKISALSIHTLDLIDEAFCSLSMEPYRFSLESLSLMENSQPSEPETPNPHSTPEGSPASAQDGADHAHPHPTATNAEPANPSEETKQETSEHEHSNQSSPEPGSLEDFAVRSQRARLSLEEEALAGTLLKGILLGGRAEVARAIKIIPSLPWIITVQGTAAAWPEMKPSFRSQLLAGLAKSEDEGAARVRLSLARGLFKVDSAATMKLILLTLKVMRDKSTGLLMGKGAPLFANVLIGRGKAWALQLPTSDLKPAELDLLINAALHAAFHAPQAPITQLSILRWAGAMDRLSGRPEALTQLITRGIAKWSGKWQHSLRKEVQNFPEAWLEVLKPGPHTPSGQSESAEAPSRESESHPEEEKEDTERHSEDTGSSSQDERTSENRRHEESTDKDEEEEDDDDQQQDEPDSRRTSGSSERKPRPVYVSKTVPSQNHHQNQNQNPSSSGSASGQRRGGPAQHFNLSDTLRQIEQYANGLRLELQSAQKQLRLREDDRRSRRPERPSAPIVSGEPSIEELARLNQQLENRNAELAARIEELTADSEDRAASRGLITDAPAPDINTELRTLLTFKLREDFEDFKALEEAGKDLVVQQHYQSVLRHVFEVLEQEGFRFPPLEQRPE